MVLASPASPRAAAMSAAERVCGCAGERETVMAAHPGRASSISSLWVTDTVRRGLRHEGEPRHGALGQRECVPSSRALFFSLRLPIYLVESDLGWSACLHTSPWEFAPSTHDAWEATRVDPLSLLLSLSGNHEGLPFSSRILHERLQPVCVSGLRAPRFTHVLCWSTPPASSADCVSHLLTANTVNTANTGTTRRGK